MLVAKEDGRLTGVLPVLVSKGVLKSPTNWHTPAFGAVSEGSKATTSALCDKLLSVPTHHISLAFLDRDDPLLHICTEKATTRRYRTLHRVQQRSPYLRLDDGWDSYRSTLSTKLLAEIRRRRRRLAEEVGDVRVEVFAPDEQLDDLLTVGFRLEATGWKAERGTAIGSRGDTAHFYRDVARWAAGKRWLRLAFLYAGSVPIAFDFCLEDGSVHYLIKTGYDSRYSRFAPGVLMRHEMISRAFASSLSVYEFLGEAQSWKREWTKAVHERVLFQAFSPSPLGQFQWAAHAYGRPMLKRVLRRPGTTSEAARRSVAETERRG